jgi:transposase
MSLKRAQPGRTIAERLSGSRIASLTPAKGADAWEKKRTQLFRLLYRVNGGEITASEAARQLGVHRSTVGRWAKRYDERGAGFLDFQPKRSGRRRKLTPAQEQWIVRTLTKRSPSEFGFEAEHWTARLIIELFRREFGIAVAISESKISRLRTELRVKDQR